MREVSANDLRPDLSGRQIDVHAVPRVVPAPVGKKTRQYLDVEIALAREVTVESPASQAGGRHDLVDGHLFESATVEQLASRLNDLLSNRVAMAVWVGHALLDGRQQRQLAAKSSRVILHSRVRTSEALASKR